MSARPWENNNTGKVKKNFGSFFPEKGSNLNVWFKFEPQVNQPGSNLNLFWTFVEFEPNVNHFKVQNWFKFEPRSNLNQFWINLNHGCLMLVQMWFKFEPFNRKTVDLKILWFTQGSNLNHWFILNVLTHIKWQNDFVNEFKIGFYVYFFEPMVIFEPISSIIHN
jgi:hypothetical protein